MVQQEELELPVQQKTPTETPAETPADTNFDSANYEYAPLPKSGFSLRGILEWSFEKMHPRTKIVQKKTLDQIKQDHAAAMSKHTQISHLREERILFSPDAVPEGYEVSNGILIAKKSLAEKVRDQIKYPWIKSSSGAVKGIAAIVLCIGAFMIYAQIPGHPEIVIGIVLVSLAGNVIMANW